MFSFSCYPCSIFLIIEVLCLLLSLFYLSHYQCSLSLVILVLFFSLLMFSFSCYPCSIFLTIDVLFLLLYSFLFFLNFHVIFLSLLLKFLFHASSSYRPSLLSSLFSLLSFSATPITIKVKIVERRARQMSFSPLSACCSAAFFVPRSLTPPKYLI